ncbi:hypothetical protein [Paenibacillus sp. FSL P2-0136]|uniref:hypothetical protein n=1 Tax=unclassified Paenibacillus TaxID=185978 RepID=UPI0030DAC181
MGKRELTPEEQFLKEGDRSAHWNTVDVHEPVMKALGLEGALTAEEDETLLQTLPPSGEAPKVMRRMETRTGRRQKRMPVKGWAAAVLALVLLGGGYTQFSGKLQQGAEAQSSGEVRQGAGAPYKVLPYQPLPATASGGMLIEKAKEPLKPYIPEAQPGIEHEANQKLSILYNQKYSKGAALMKELLLPGEYATYVITREDEEGEGSMNMYRPPLTFKDYTAYKTSVEEHNAPVLEQPAYLPEGYALDEAIIKPSFLKVPDVQELKGGNERDLGDNFQLAWRVEKAENIDYPYSSLVYKKGEVQVRIGVSRVDDYQNPADKLSWSEHTKMENIEIKGRQAIFSDDSGNKELDLGFKYELVWSDPSGKVIYSVIAGQENTELTKDELIGIAASMMK